MGIKYSLDREKAMEVLLYIAARCNDTYHALKVLYFADKDHLGKYGNLICSDTYVALRYGPVPSYVYNLVRCVRGDAPWWWGDFDVSDFGVEGNRIIPRRAANLDMLSHADIECLDAAIDKYGDMPFGELMRISHDDAYNAADENDDISFESIMQTLPDGDLLLEHLRCD